MYYKTLGRGVSDAIDTVLNTISADFRQRFTLDTFTAQWCLVVTWDQLEYFKASEQVFFFFVIK